MAEQARSYLLVPAGGAGNGIGHLRRSIELARRLRGRVSFLTTHLDAGAQRLLKETLARQPSASRPRLVSRLASGTAWDLVVVDARKVGAEELRTFSRHGLVVCVDEGGDSRDIAPFLVDTPLGPRGRPPANVSGPQYLFLPPRKKKAAPKGFRRVLVSMGGEDREALGPRLVKAIVDSEVFRPEEVTVVRGPLSAAGPWPPGVSVVSGGALSRILPRYDLLITHFGMSAFEALATGVPVILFNPSVYHESLGKSAGFPMIGVGTPDMQALRKLTESPSALYSQVESFRRQARGAAGPGMDRLLSSLSRVGDGSCPVCGKDGNPVVARFPDRTYRRCRACGSIGLESFAERKHYGAAYFSSEYKAQYGRTYLEDFESIRAASRPRAAIVRTLLGGRGGTVLDVGCAYGPFLAAASDVGLQGFGLDISAAAAAHVRTRLGIPAIHGAFETVPRSRLPRSISAVTMWYVIEHFPRTLEILARASSLLPPGGVMAFSTPNGRGVSARKDLNAFLHASPADHFSVLSPRGLRRILAAHGLHLRKVRVTGHHPERFPGAAGAAARRWPLAMRVLRAASVALRLGDTFEAYAVKGGA